MGNRQGFQHFAARAVTEIAFATVGTAFLVCALIANQRFLDRHFLPSFLFPRHWYVVLQTLGRVVLLILGALLVSLFGRVLHALPRERLTVFQIVVAIVLAFGTSELVMRHVHIGPAEWLSSNEEPRRIPDPRLGWIWAPLRTGHKTIGGRVIDYAIDPAGYRVNHVEEPVDPDQPTILFIGESVMFGEGLTWQESVPAQVGSILGMQTANLAVHGYGNDQAYFFRQRSPIFADP